MASLGPRITILGPPASGKTRLTRHLGQHLSLPVVELDQYLWERGARSHEARITARREAVARGSGSSKGLTGRRTP